MALGPGSEDVQESTGPFIRHRLIVKPDRVYHSGLDDRVMGSDESFPVH
jgi:hypothetical protein